MAMRTFAVERGGSELYTFTSQVGCRIHPVGLRRLGFLPAFVHNSTWGSPADATQIASVGGSLVRYAGLSLQAPSEAVARMALEKRASVLEGALRRNPSSIKLRTALLHLADQLQEPDVVDALWKRGIEK